MTGNNERIKICYLIGSLRLGGAEKQVVELALGLDKSKYEIEIICINQGGKLVQEVRKSGVSVKIFQVGLPYGKLNPRSWPVLLRSIWQIWRRLKHTKPDIVHGYLFTAYVVGIICGRLAGVPILISARRSLGYFKDDKKWRQPLENFVNKRTDVILANSEAVKNDCLKREKHIRGKIRVIYNGIDLEKYRPDPVSPEMRKQLGVSTNDVVVGCVANLIHYKGHLEIVKAASMLCSEFPELKFVFVGRDGGMKKPVEEKREALGLEGKVVLAGSRVDIDRIIPSFDILLLASHEEGFSNVLLEGMACGKPIVATDVGGNAESVIDGETGLIVPTRNPEAMAKAIKKLLNSPQLRKKMGKAGRRRMEKHFSKERLIEDMDKFYSSLL